MKKTLLSILCFCFLFSCKIYNHKTQLTVNPTTVEKETMGESIIYTYEDSLSIGEQGKYKLCATGSRLPSENWDMLLLKTNLSEKYVNDWISIQNLTGTVYDNACVDIETEDINNDGMGDFSFQYALAGRGFNVLRKHYIFDKNKKQLVAIKNSPEYPNLTYNEDLDCMESNIGYGGYSTVFF